MKKTGMILMMLAMALVLFPAYNAEAGENRMNFKVYPEQEVQKYINFSFSAPWTCKTYRLERGYPFFDRKATWKEIMPGENSGPGRTIFRFIGSEYVDEVSIYGETYPHSGCNVIQDTEDVSLLIKDSWIPFDLGLPRPCDINNGKLMYSYYWLSPGWGTSICLKYPDKHMDFSGKCVAIMTFNGAGFPCKIFWTNSKRLTDEWVNPGEIALLIFYEGDNWKKDRKDFYSKIREVNQTLKKLSN